MKKNPQEDTSKDEEDIENKKEIGTKFNDTDLAEIYENIKFDITDISFITTREFLPYYMENEIKERKKYEVDIPTTFDDLPYFKLKVCNEAHIIGYKDQEIPAIPTYIPLKKDKKLLEGVTFENNIRAPRLLNDIDPLFQPTINEIDDKHKDNIILNSNKQQNDNKQNLYEPSSQYRYYSEINCLRETENEFILQPHTWKCENHLFYPKRNEWLQEIGKSSLDPSCNHITLSDLWIPINEKKFSSIQEKYYFEMDTFIKKNTKTRIFFKEIKKNGWNDLNIINNNDTTNNIQDDNLSESESDNEIEKEIKIPDFNKVHLMFKDKNDIINNNNINDSYMNIKTQRINELEKYYYEKTLNSMNLLSKSIEDINKKIDDERYKLYIGKHKISIPHHTMETTNKLMNLFS